MNKTLNIQLICGACGHKTGYHIGESDESEALREQSGGESLDPLLFAEGIAYHNRCEKCLRLFWTPDGFCTICDSCLKVRDT